MTYYLSSAYGFRWDVMQEGESLMSFYVLPDGDSMVVLNHEESTWLRLPVEKRGPVQSPLSPDEDPEEYIRRFLARGYRELGRSVINNVTVEGVEVSGPPVGEDSYLEGVGRLWVEVGTSLPIRLELTGIADGREMEWLMDFSWGEQVDIEEFTPVIPPGFTPPPVPDSGD
jgi:hypothetical protein